MRAVVLRDGTLDEVPEAIDQVRRGAGSPRIVVHPGAS